MKKIVLAASLLVVGAFGLRAQTLVQSFDDIQFWTGSGTNRSALVLQWNDGSTPTSLAWGYRWSGNATGIDMLKAIAGATTLTPEGDPSNILATSIGSDSRMTLRLQRYSWGDAIFSISLNEGLQNRTRAAWAMNEYWEYYVFGGNFDYLIWNADSLDPDGNEIWKSSPANYSQNGNFTYSLVNWLSAPIGASERKLVDGSWDAFSFATGNATNTVMQPYAVSVPEPSVAILVTIALVFFMLRQRTNA
jgi:hypothetical protein